MTKAIVLFQRAGTDEWVRQKTIDILDGQSNGRTFNVGGRIWRLVHSSAGGSGHVLFVKDENEDLAVEPHPLRADGGVESLVSFADDVGNMYRLLHLSKEGERVFR